MAGDIMSLLESGENYLESILVLSQKQKEIHAIDVVNYLGYSKPSVSIMLKKLKEAGYIIINEESHIFLTDKGLEVANRIYNRHKLLKNFLISIGVSEDVAEDDACKIEHDLSDETIEAIRKTFDK